MAGYYNKDPDFDYSKELQRTDLTASERDRLTKERQNKIDDKYNKREPNMTGSDKTYTQLYGGGEDSSSSGDTSELVKGPGYVTGGYTPGAVYGTPMLEKNPYFKDPVNASGADMSRRPDLAGRYAVSNGYTVFYDEDGYAVRAKKGVTDYTPHRDINAENGTYNQSGAWSDNEVLTAADRQRIQDIRARMQAGQLSGDEANRLANEIRSGYGYTIDKAGNVTDLGALSGVDARRRAWGLPTNDVSAEQQNFLHLMFPEQETRDGGTLLDSLYALNQGTYRQPQRGLSAPGSAPQPGGGPGGGSFSGGFGGSDLSAYLMEMYQQNTAAQQAALKAAYEQNLAAYEAQDDLIANAHQQQRNQAAGQNELQRLQMAEMGISQGLNTGASGQLALAQSAALQGSLADIGSAEAQAMAENALAMRQLEAQYQNAAAQALAEGNAQLANALYNEYVRQENLAWEQYQYQQEQERRDRQTAQADAVNRAELLAGFGDFSGYRALGYSDGDIALMQRAYDAQVGTNFEQGSTGGRSSGAGGGTHIMNNSGGEPAARYTPGNIPADQLQRMKQSIGMNRTQEGRMNAIRELESGGTISEALAESLLQSFGLM